VSTQFSGEQEAFDDITFDVNHCDVLLLVSFYLGPAVVSDV
jgi:hypothetical protein